MKNTEGKTRDNFSYMSPRIWKSDIGGFYRAEKLGLGEWKFLRLTSTSKIKTRQAVYV